jgi:hypothetical protein
MDVLDLVIPDPTRVIGLVRVERNPSEDVEYQWNGHTLAHAWSIDDLDDEYRLPSLVTDLGGCTVLRIDREVLDAASRAHREDVRSPFSLEEALRAVLDPQPYWYVWCEREVDTHPLLKRSMNVDECVAAAVARASDEAESFDFVAWPHERAVQTRLDWTGAKRSR